MRGVLILGKELRRHPERARRELRARSAAAAVALQTCVAHSGSLREVRMVMFGNDAYQCWLRVAQAVL